MLYVKHVWVLLSQQYTTQRDWSCCHKVPTPTVSKQDKVHTHNQKKIIVPNLQCKYLNKINLSINSAKLTVILAD